jgi:hypothetical protein
MTGVSRWIVNVDTSPTGTFSAWMAIEPMKYDIPSAGGGASPGSIAEMVTDTAGSLGTIVTSWPATFSVTEPSSTVVVVVVLVDVVVVDDVVDVSPPGGDAVEQDTAPQRQCQRERREADSSPHDSSSPSSRSRRGPRRMPFSER